MKFNPIGSKFIEGNIILVVEESKNGLPLCEGCWYAYKKGKKHGYNKSCYRHGHACTSGNRKDKKQVIFKKLV